MPPISAKSGRVRKKSFATSSRTSPRKLSSFARATAAQASRISVTAAVDELVAPGVGLDDAVSLSVAGAQRDSSMIEQDADRAVVYHADAAASAASDVDEVREDEDDSEDEQHGQGTHKKRRPLRVQLDDDVEEELVGWFRDHPELFNKKVKAHKFTEKKQTLKTSKAKELNITVAELDTWFKSRTMFGKLVKTVSGQGAPKYTERQKWVLDRLSFLKDHLVVKNNVTLGGPSS